MRSVVRYASSVVHDLVHTSWDEWETFAWRVFILFAYWLMLLGFLTAR